MTLCPTTTTTTTSASPPPSLYKYNPYATLLDPIAISNQLNHLHPHSSFFQKTTTMSSCGNCDCADKSQCVKKGNSYSLDIVETDKSYGETFVMDAPAAEHDGKCKCGASCACTNCTCGH